MTPKNLKLFINTIDDIKRSIVALEALLESQLVIEETIDLHKKINEISNEKEKTKLQEMLSGLKTTKQST